MDEGRVDINIIDSPGIFIEDLDDDIGVDVIFDDNVEIDIAPSSIPDHGQLAGLGDDDHPQYLNEARGDARYEAALGNPSVDDYILASKTTGQRYWTVPAVIGGSGITDHGLLTGLGDDDHTQYFNTARGDARYSQLAHRHDLDYISIISPRVSGNFPVIDLVGELGDSGYKPSSFEAAISKTSAGYLRWTGAAWEFKNETYLGALSGLLENDIVRITSAGQLVSAGIAYTELLTGITKGMVEAVLIGNITSHTHNYEPAISKSTGYLYYTGSAWDWRSANEVYTGFQTLTSSATLSWNMNDGYNAKVTLAHNATLSISNLSNGMSGCLIVAQDSTGGRTLTLPSGSKILGGGIFSLTSAPNSYDILTFVYDGTYLYWSVGNNYLGVI